MGSFAGWPPKVQYDGPSEIVASPPAQPPSAIKEVKKKRPKKVSKTRLRGGKR